MTAPYVPMSAIERLLSQMGQGPQGGLYNPNTPPQNATPVPRGTPQGLMAAPEQMPNVATPPRPTGLRGLLSRINDLGQPELDPTLASQLSPEEVERAESGGGLLKRVGIQAMGMGLFTPGIQARYRAEQMLADKDAGKVRADAQAREQQRQRILAQAGPRPEDPAKAADWMDAVARTVVTSPVRDPEFAEETRLAADQLRQGLASQAGNRVIRDVLGRDGKKYIVTQNAMGQEIARVPQAEAAVRNTWRTRAQPSEDGFIVQENTDGQIRKTNIRALPGQQGYRQIQGRIQRENQLRTATEDEAAIADALREVDTNPDAFGLRNLLPQVVLQNNPMRPEAEREADAFSIGTLEYVVGRLRHDRFGAALTVGEAERALRVFSEPKSTPAAIRAQLRVIQRAVRRHQEAVEDQLENNTPTTPTPQGPRRPAGFEP